MKKLVLLMAVCVISLVAFTSEKMSDNGKAGYTGSYGELYCTDCHSTYALGAGGGSVALTSTNMSAWTYDPGVTYHMVATVSRTGNSLFGICVEALTTANVNAGTLVITNTAKTSIKTKTVSGVSRRSVVHTLNAGQGTNSYAFTFDWTAPASNIGDVSFFFTGVAANSNGNENGDYVYYGSQVVGYNVNNSISELTSVKEISVYPMPVQDHFTMNYELKNTGSVSINLYNIQGAIVSNLSHKVMSPGNYSDNFYLPEQLSAGTYILSVESESGITSKRILIN